MVWHFIGTFAAGALLGFVTAMLMKARGMQSREEEMREYFLAELKRACDNAIKQTEEEMRIQKARKPDVITVDAVSVLPRAIIDDPHFQNRLKQAGADFASDYAKGVGL